MAIERFYNARLSQVLLVDPKSRSLNLRTNAEETFHQMPQLHFMILYFVCINKGRAMSRDDIKGWLEESAKQKFDSNEVSSLITHTVQAIESFKIKKLIIKKSSGWAIGADWMNPISLDKNPKDGLKNLLIPSNYQIPYVAYRLQAPF